jgi:hypothetical protein
MKVLSPLFFLLLLVILSSCSEHENPDPYTIPSKYEDKPTMGAWEQIEY